MATGTTNRNGSNTKGKENHRSTGGRKQSKSRVGGGGGGGGGHTAAPKAHAAASPKASQSKRPGAASASQRSNGSTATERSKITTALASGGEKVRSAVKEHPLTATLTGAGLAGLAWLVYEGIKHDYPQAAYASSRQAMKSAGSGVSRAVTSATRSVSSGAEASYNAVANLWDEHPLAVGLGIVAAAVAAGLLLPSTRLEQQTVGRSAGKVVQRVESTAETLVQRGKRVARRALQEGSDAMTEEADRVGLTPEKLVRKVSRVAGRVREAVASSTDD